MKQLFITRKGTFKVEGGKTHNTPEECYEEASKIAWATPGKAVTVTPPPFEVIVREVADPPVDPPAPPPVDPPAPPPVDPPAPPPITDIPAGTRPVGQTLTADKTTVMVGDHVNVSAMLNYDDAPSQPVTAYAFGWDKKILSAPNGWTPRFLALAPGVTTITSSNSGTTAKVQITVIENDGTVFPPDPPAPPAPPAGSPPAGSPPTPPVDNTKPAASKYGDFAKLVGTGGNGPNMVEAEVVDAADRLWRAVGYVSDDPKTPALLIRLADSDGKPHPRLVAQLYANVCHVHVASMNNAFNEIGCKSIVVKFNGEAVPIPPSSYADGTFDFWKGCWMPAIRYGKQAVYTDAQLRALVDRSVLPHYPAPSQALVDESDFDFTWNGKGGTNQGKMGTTGERDEIAFEQRAYMSFILNPTAKNWAVVLRIEDACGNWNNVYACEPTTGTFIKYTDYISATIMPAAQAASWQGNNPVALYKGSYKGDELIPPKSAWENGGSPYEPNTAHLTSYGLSAMIARDAHANDLAAFWANYCFIDQNPVYTRDTGFVWGAQRRFAWALRSVFLAAYYSSDTEFFSAELDRNRAIFDKVPRNDLGILPTDFGYVGKGGADGYTGMAQWMQNYFIIVGVPVALKRPDWRDSMLAVCKLYAVAHSYPFAMCFTIYGLMCKDANGKLLTDFKEVMRLSLENNGYTDENALACVNATTVKECYDAVIANSKLGGQPAWPGKYDAVNDVADYLGYLNSPSAYAATTIAAVESAASLSTPGIEKALYIVRHQPTPIDFAKAGNEKSHITEIDKAA